MTLTIRPHEMDAAELTPTLLAPPSAEPLSGDIPVRGSAVFITDDRAIISGVWESDPGASRREFLTRGEIVHILKGRMTVQRDGEELVELTPGSAAYFPVGWTGTWTVIEPVRKLYVVYKPGS